MVSILDSMCSARGWVCFVFFCFDHTRGSQNIPRSVKGCAGFDVEALEASTARQSAARSILCPYGSQCGGPLGWCTSSEKEKTELLYCRKRSGDGWRLAVSFVDMANDHNFHVEPLRIHSLMKRNGGSAAQMNEYLLVWIPLAIIESKGRCEFSYRNPREVAAPD